MAQDAPKRRFLSLIFFVSLLLLLLIWKEGGRGLMIVECCVREEENTLGFYVGNSEENLIKGVYAAETINTEDTVSSGEF